MKIKEISALLMEHSFFSGMKKKDIDLISACGKNVIFRPEEYIAKDNDLADYFYLIQEGKVAVEVFVASQGPVIIQTLDEGDILGWSWLFPPYQWAFDVKATETVHAIALDGKCLREKCEKDTRLGFDLMKRFAQIFTRRLEATRMQLLDVFAVPPQ